MNMLLLLFEESFIVESKAGFRQLFVLFYVFLWNRVAVDKLELVAITRAHIIRARSIS